jgi:hypothetical protein
MKRKSSHPSHSLAMGIEIIRGLSFVDDSNLLSISVEVGRIGFSSANCRVLIGNAIGSPLELSTIV